MNSLSYAIVYEFSEVFYEVDYEMKEQQKTKRLLGRRGFISKKKRRCTSPSYSNSSPTTTCVYSCPCS